MGTAKSCCAFLIYRIIPERRESAFGLGIVNPQTMIVIIINGLHC